jgi:hypothetical protein
MNMRNFMTIFLPPLMLSIALELLWIKLRGNKKFLNWHTIMSAGATGATIRSAGSMT